MANHRFHLRTANRQEAPRTLPAFRTSSRRLVAASTRSVRRNRHGLPPGRSTPGRSPQLALWQVFVGLKGGALCVGPIAERRRAHLTRAHVHRAELLGDCPFRTTAWPVRLDGEPGKSVLCGCEGHHCAPEGQSGESHPTPRFVYAATVTLSLRAKTSFPVDPSSSSPESPQRCPINSFPSKARNGVQTRDGVQIPGVPSPVPSTPATLSKFPRMNRPTKVAPQPRTAEAPAKITFTSSSGVANCPGA